MEFKKIFLINVYAEYIYQKKDCTGYIQQSCEADSQKQKVATHLRGIFSL